MTKQITKQTNSQKILHRRIILPFFYSNEQAHAYAVIVTFLYLSTKSVFVLGEERAIIDTFLCLSTKSVFVLSEERALEQQRLNSRRLLKKSIQKKRHPDVRRGIVTFASLGEGKTRR